MGAPEPQPSRAPRLPVTVVVCTHDRPRLLGGCLSKVAEAMTPDDQLVVVESGRGHAGAVDPVGAAEPARPPRWQHVTTTAPGKSAKLNIAIRRARSEVLVFTDDDCLVDPGWLDAMAAPFAGAPSLGVAFGPVEGLDHVPGSPAQRLPPGPAPIESWAYAHGASMAVRRAAVIDVGGFDERLGPGAASHGEEADLVVRMAARHWTSMIADAPPVIHVEWRSPEQTMANLLVYERGAGAWLGAGLRRDPLRVGKLLILRLRYQAELWRERGVRGPWFGPRTTAAFLGGVAKGLTYPPRRWL